MRMLLIWLVLLTATDAWANRARVAVVISDDLEAYQEPVPAFLAAVGVTPSPSLFNIRGREAEAREVVARLTADPPDVVYAVGAKAAYAIRNGLPNVPLVYAAVMEPSRYGIEGRQVTGVTMEVHPVGFLSQFVSFFPEIKNVGVIVGADMDDDRVREMRGAATELGMAMQVERVDSPRQVRQAFRRLVDRQIDALWLPPDRGILTRDTYRGLTEETRRRRLPLLVDTTNMVHAGGAFAVVPDPASVGRQAAGLVQEILGGAAPAVLEPQHPETLLVVLNARVLEQANLPFDPLLRDFVDVMVE